MVQVLLEQQVLWGSIFFTKLLATVLSLFFPLVVSVWIKKYKKMQKGYGLFFCQALLFFLKGKCVC